MKPKIRSMHNEFCRFSCSKFFILLPFSFLRYNRGLIDDGQDTFHIVPETENEVGCAK